MTPETDKILRNLGVIARLKSNERLLTGFDFFEIQSPTPWQSFRRFYNNETRDQNMKAVTECIRLAKTLITTTLSERADVREDQRRGTVTTEVMLQEEMHTCNRVAQALISATDGLQNLQTTYRDDAALLVRITELCVDIQNFVGNIATSVGLAPITE